MKLLLMGAGASYSTKDVENGYLDALRAAGHEVIHYILDARIEESQEFLSRRWKKLGRGKVPQDAILTHAGSDALRQAVWHQVDGVLIISGMYLRREVLVLFKRAGIPTSVIFTESPYSDRAQAMFAPDVDVCFTNERTSVPVLQRANPRTYYLPCAFSPQHHRPDLPIDETLPTSDVLFIGTGFQERIDLLSAVDWDGIDLALYGTWDLLPSRHRLRRYIRGGVVSNEKAAALYRRTKIGLNLYRQSIDFGRNSDHIQHAESLNPRAVELAACGVFTISDWRAEVGEVFVHSVPTFSALENETNAHFLGKMVRYWLTNDTERQAIQAQLPSKVAHLTFEARAHDVVTTLREAWGHRGSVAQAAD